MASLASVAPDCSRFWIIPKSRQIAALRRGGVDEIGVGRGYRAEMIDLPGLSYFLNQRWAEINMVMSIATAAARLRSAPVIVSYGDIFYRSELVRGLAAPQGGW